LRSSLKFHWPERSISSIPNEIQVGINKKMKHTNIRRIIYTP
jgi:hypothetical protein